MIKQPTGGIHSLPYRLRKIADEVDAYVRKKRHTAAVRAAATLRSKKKK